MVEKTHVLREKHEQSNEHTIDLTGRRWTRYTEGKVDRYVTYSVVIVGDRALWRTEGNSRLSLKRVSAKTITDVPRYTAAIAFPAISL